MISRRQFLLMSAATTVTPLFVSPSTSIPLKPTRVFATPLDAQIELNERFYRLRQSISFESTLVAAAAAVPPVIVNIGTALRSFWYFLRDVGGNVIANGIYDWMKSLTTQTKTEVQSVNDMLTEGGFPKTNNSKVYRNATMNSYVFTDDANADICAPIYNINSIGKLMVDPLFLPMLEGPEAIGLEQSIKALSRKSIAAQKRARMLVPYSGVNYPNPPPTRLNSPTNEPAVFTTSEGFCGIDYQCDNSIKEGVVRVITLNPFLQTTSEGAYAIDYSAVAGRLAA